VKYFKVGLFFLAFGGPLFAADIKFGGLVFSDYEFVTSKYLANGTLADSRNAFDIGRVWLNSSVKLDEQFDSFFQFEANELSRDNTANQVYLKQAWLRWNEIYPNASLRFGLVPAPWRPYEEAAWQYRFVAKILEDEEGLLQPSDRGALLSGKYSIVDYDLEVANGEGTGARTTVGNETNKYKDFAARIGVAPFQNIPGLKVNALLHEGYRVANWPRNRTIVGLSYKSDSARLWGAYYTSRDGTSVSTGTDTVKGAGFSLHGSVDLPRNFWVFGRWDRWDSNTNVALDVHDRIIYGIGRKLGQNVRVAIDHQLVIQEQVASNRVNQSIVSAHLEVKF